MFQRDVHGVSNDHSYDASVANDQYILARKLLLPVAPALNNAVVEVRGRLATRRCVGYRISPELTEFFTIARHYLISGAPFPLSEVDFPQAVIPVQGNLVAICQFPGKVSAAQHG